MSSSLPLRPFQPIAPASTNWAAPLTPPYCAQQHQILLQQHTIIQETVLPSHFSAPRKPGLTLPKDLRAFHSPPEQIIVTKNHVFPRQKPLRTHSTNPVFYTDPTLKGAVVEFFSYSIQTKDNIRNDNGNNWQAHHKLPYDPKDNDQVAWRQRSAQDAEDSSREMKVNSSISDTWPPWNSRFDLDL